MQRNLRTHYVPALTLWTQVRSVPSTWNDGLYPQVLQAVVLKPNSPYTNKRKDCLAPSTL